MRWLPRYLKIKVGAYYYYHEIMKTYASEARARTRQSKICLEAKQLPRGLHPCPLALILRPNMLLWRCTTEQMIKHIADCPAVTNFTSSLSALNRADAAAVAWIDAQSKR